MPAYSPKVVDTKKIPYLAILKAGFLVNFSVIVLTFLGQKYLPPQIPLFYGLAQGEEQLAASIWLFLPNSLALIFLVANGLVATLIDEEFMKKILVGAGIIATFFATITTLKIFLLVGSF